MIEILRGLVIVVLYPFAEWGVTYPVLLSSTLMALIIRENLNGKATVATLAWWSSVCIVLASELCLLARQIFSSFRGSEAEILVLLLFKGLLESASIPGPFLLITSAMGKPSLYANNVTMGFAALIPLFGCVGLVGWHRSSLRLAIALLPAVASLLLLSTFYRFDYSQTSISTLMMLPGALLLLLSARAMINSVVADQRVR